MISAILGGPGIVVSNGGSTMPYVSMSNPSAGMIRYNNSNLEVYDGYIWLILQSSHAQVTLSPEIRDIVDWARDKRAKEDKLKILMEQVPAIADLQSKLDMLVILCQDYRVEEEK